MIFEKISEPLIGVHVLSLHKHKDIRGSFTKLFQYSQVELNGSLPLDVKECYISSSNRGIVRGMHFQAPPHEHSKAVTCLSGEILDVLVDIRVGSPDYGKTASIHLNANDPKLIVMPAGIAHGFITKSENASMIYFVSSEHSPEFDRGILWSSIDFDWPDLLVQTSDRDAKFPKLEELESPFVWTNK